LTSESTEPADFLEVLEGMMPELKLEELETKDSHIEEMSLALHNAEKQIAALVKSLESVVNLYTETKDELSAVKIKQDTLNDATKAANYNLANQIVKTLKIDYDILTDEVISMMGLDKEELTKRLEERYQKLAKETAIVSKIAKKVKEGIEEDLDIDTSDLEIDYGDLSEYIDYDSIAYNLCYSSLSEYLSFDPTDYWGSDDLAAHYSEDEIAEHISAEDIALHVDTDDIASEIELDNLAGHIAVVDIAQHIDLDELALFVTQNIDLDDLAQRMKGAVE